MMQKLAAFFITLIAGFVIFPTMATPAFAAPASCGSLGVVCFYDNPGGAYTGPQYNFVPSAGVCNRLPSFWDNIASAVWNQTPYNIKLYSTTNCTSTVLSRPLPYSGEPSLANWCYAMGHPCPKWDNRVSSWKAI